MSITSEACSTFTGVVIYLIHTGAVVLAGLGDTLVDVQVAVIALKSRHTKALVAINAVPANGSVLTGFWLAFIYVHLTLVTLVTGLTLTPEPGVRDIYTGAAVLTDLLWTCGDIVQAVRSSLSKGTVAGVSVVPVDTKWADAITWIALTLVHVLSAVETSETIWTVAGELVSPRDTGAVGAWCSDAGVKQLLTVPAHEPHRSFRAQAHVVV